MNLNSTQNPAYVLGALVMDTAEALGLELVPDFFKQVAEASLYCEELVPIPPENKTT